MKKLFRCFLCSVLALSSIAFASCGEEESKYKKAETYNDMTPEQTYEAIIGEIEEQKDNFESLVTYDITCKITTSGQSATLNMEMTDVFKMADGNFYEYTYVNSGMGADTDVTMYVWYVDGTAYVDSSMMGQVQKSKLTATLEEICTQAGIEMDEMLNPIYDFSDQSFDNVKFNIGEEDVYFELVLKGDDASQFASKRLDSMGIGGDMTLSSIKYKFYVDEEGKLDYAKIDYTATMKTDGMTCKYTFDGKIEFSNVGTTVVTAPENSDSFTDVTPPSTDETVE